MTQRPEHAAGEPAPAAGIYEQLDIFGSPTGIRAKVMCGHLLPAAPLGHNWARVNDVEREA
jgi:hypothetical protein